MAQLLVRNLDDVLKEQIRAQAKAKGRSLEEEARAILKSGVSATPAADELGWATKINRKFRQIGLTNAEFAEFDEAISSLRGSPVRPAELE